MKICSTGRVFTNMSKKHAQLEVFFENYKENAFSCVQKACPTKQTFLITVQKTRPNGYAFYTLFPKSTYLTN